MWAIVHFKRIVCTLEKCEPRLFYFLLTKIVELVTCDVTLAWIDLPFIWPGTTMRMANEKSLFNKFYKKSLPKLSRLPKILHENFYLISFFVRNRKKYLSIRSTIKIFESYNQNLFLFKNHFILKFSCFSLLHYTIKVKKEDFSKSNPKNLWCF